MSLTSRRAGPDPLDYRVKQVAAGEQHALREGASAGLAAKAIYLKLCIRIAK